LAILPQRKEPFTIGSFRHEAMHYVVKAEIGGVTGFLARRKGKQPADTHVWVLSGEAPAFVKAEGPFYVGGPIWRIQLASAGLFYRVDKGCSVRKPIRLSNLTEEIFALSREMRLSHYERQKRHSRKQPMRPNQAMQPTAGRRTAPLIL